MLATDASGTVDALLPLWFALVQRHGGNRRLALRLVTLHAHTQVLGKLAARLAPPEPQLQHAALRLTARGWETAPLPAPDGSGSLVAALDLCPHEAVVEHSAGRVQRVALAAFRAPYRGRSTPVNAWWGSFDLAVSMFSGAPA